MEGKDEAMSGGRRRMVVYVVVISFKSFASTEQEEAAQAMQ